MLSLKCLEHSQLGNLQLPDPKNFLKRLPAPKPLKIDTKLEYETLVTQIKN